MMKFLKRFTQASTWGGISGVAAALSTVAGPYAPFLIVASTVAGSLAVAINEKSGQ